MAFAFGGCIWGHALEFETMGRICSSVLFLKWMDKERGKERSVVGVLPELLLVLADCRERCSRECFPFSAFLCGEVSVPVLVPLSQFSSAEQNPTFIWPCVPVNPS